MVKPRNLNLAVLRNDPNEIYEGTCLSTDTKPTNWPDNSILFELDTGTRYYSNSGTWYPVGGADGGSSGVNVVNLDDIPAYATEVDGYEFSNYRVIKILYDDQTILPTRWFVNTAPQAPVMLYEYLGDGVNQYFPSTIDTIQNYEAEFSGNEVAGAIYLMSADELTLYYSEREGDTYIHAFLTNPTFRLIPFS